MQKIDPREFKPGECGIIYTTWSALPYHVFNIEQYEDGLKADYESVLVPKLVHTGWFPFSGVLTAEIHDA